MRTFGFVFQFGLLWLFCRRLVNCLWNVSFHLLIPIDRKLIVVIGILVVILAFLSVISFHNSNNGIGFWFSEKKEKRKEKEINNTLNTNWTLTRWQCGTICVRDHNIQISHTITRIHAYSHTYIRVWMRWRSDSDSKVAVVVVVDDGQRQLWQRFCS